MGKGHGFHSLGVALVFLVAKVAKVAGFTRVVRITLMLNIFNRIYFYGSKRR